MAVVKATIKSNVSPKLKSLKRQISDMTPFFKDLADLELSQTKLRFLDEKDPAGKKWKDPFTIRRGTGPETGTGERSTKRGWDYVVSSNYHATPPGYRFWNRNRGDKILRDTGRLFKSIGRAYGTNYAVVGTNVSYARKLQFGIGVAQRAMFGINKQTYSNINKLAKIYFGRVK